MPPGGRDVSGSLASSDTVFARELSGEHLGVRVRFMVDEQGYSGVLTDIDHSSATPDTVTVFLRTDGPWLTVDVPASAYIRLD